MFSKSKFIALASHARPGAAHVSLFVPTARAGRNQEDQIAFKNALSEASSALETRLEAQWNPHEFERFFRPAQELLDDADFWMHLSDGLVVFLAENFFEHYIVPVSFRRRVYVGEEFFLLPLVPLLNRNQRLFLLALSQNQVRLFELHPHHIVPIRIDDLVPTSMEQVVGGDKEAALQAHSGNPSQSLIFHGHGGGKEHRKTELEKFLRQVDRGLLQILHDEDAPLMLAGVDFLVEQFRALSHHPNILPVHVSGNPDKDDPILLHEKAWVQLQPHFQREFEQMLEQARQALALGQGSVDLTTILPAAMQGRVHHLFYRPESDCVWGSLDESTQRVHLHPERTRNSRCLLNWAVTQTILKNGSAYPLEPHQLQDEVETALAVYRY